MELEEMDKTYVENKAILDKTGKTMTTLETLKTEVKSLKRQIEDIQIEIIRAKEDKETAKKVKRLEAALKAPKSELASKREQLQKLEATVRQSQIIVSQKMAEISKDPILKAHLKDVIEKKFSRQLAKIEKDKEEKIKQNEPLKRIQEAAQKNPNIIYVLKEIEKYVKLEAKLQASISNPTKSDDEKKKDQKHLESVQRLLSKSRAGLTKYFKGTIPRDVIDQITSYEDLEKQIKSNNKYLIGLDKQIANYTTALENIGVLTPYRTVEPEPEPEPQPQPNNLPANKPKWYQFGARFKNWVARLKSNVEPEPELEPQAPEIEPIPISEEQKNQFKDSLKYDIVKDYEERLATNLLRQAKAKNRETPDDNEVTDMDRDDL